ncbi:hypothetical protein FNO01nite_17030 [Flavobacterium noncentrifugens]|nr:hypothetical protein FNO01nite_17030 [Flavobacterium noncentrifugens]
MNFTETASNALRMAVRIAVANKAQLNIIHVIKPMKLEQFANVHQKVVAMLKSVVTRTISDMTKESSDKIEIVTMTINFEVEMGDVGAIINEFEKSSKIDLTIIGTHGVRSLQEMWSGTTAMEILKHTSCPALTIPCEFKNTTIDSVLYPIRNTDGYATKLDYLIPFSIRSKLKLHLVAIYKVSDVDEVYGLTNKLKEVRDNINSEDVTVSYEIIASESISRSILEAAKKMKVDLIVMNATMDRKWYDLFTSHSFTNRMINDSTIPILCIKPELLKPLMERADKTNRKNEVYIPIM